ncbi:hypothetical protein V2J09_005923 [Rumex salicifolius]
MSRQMPTSQFPKSKTLDNKYMLGDEIGKGAYGRVYKGLDLENGDFVAIKQVSLENIAQEDLNIIMNLNHKNIVKYLGSSKTRSHLHIILEYVENGSLANIIKPNKFGPFPEQLVAHYIAQVLEGLVYLHEQGVIHRDIKGANILTTKEGWVKLADFGVATKLTEADVNTHSVVGTPYWMAPEVIEMSGVCAASDIWSVGCTVIELLTCLPPYYELQPMPALFRIVQDEHPPIPDGISADITDFLKQCFKKDARQRPDAKTLLSHPWIQNYRRTLQPSLAHNDTLRSQDSSLEVESNEDEQGPAGSLSTDIVSEGDKPTQGVAGAQNSDTETGSSSIVNGESVENVNDFHTDQVPTLAIHEKSSNGSGSSQISANGDMASVSSKEDIVNPDKGDQNELLPNGEIGSPKRKEFASAKHERKASAVQKVNSLFSFGSRGQDVQKVAKSGALAGNELSRFSDTPGDASLDDLFHPLGKNPDDQVVEPSTSASASQNNEGSGVLNDIGKNNLAKKLRDAIAQKQMDNDIRQPRPNGGNLFHVMMQAKDVIDIDSSLVFDDKLPGENLFPLQAVEFSKLVSSLRPEEPEDSIISACQKLITFFNQRPEQKVMFITQHGLLPLMELLDIPRPRVLCSVLQVINQIVRDNTDFQENACLVGLIPVVMSFAVPDRPREVRMQAAYFLQQLCQSSSLTLQMFIACRGIPVLVGFLEPDYAKFREMVHLAIDGMWQVFKLQVSTPRNDFCRIAARNGILLRLINTLYSLNEATRLASTTASSGFSTDCSVPRPRSGQLDPSHPAFQNDALASGADHIDLRVRHPTNDSSSGVQEASHLSISQSQRQDVSQSESRSVLVDSDRAQSSNATGEVSIPSRVADLSVNRTSLEHRIGNSASRTSLDRPRKSLEIASEGPGISSQQVRPLLSLLEKEPPSRHFSGQLEYVRHLTGMERHDSILPLLHASNERKTNGELEYLMAEFAEVAGCGRENGNSEMTPRMTQRTLNKIGSAASNDGVTSTSGIASQAASGVLSGSGVLNARPGSATSSGFLSHMGSTMNADVAKEYLEKVAELLLEFARADTTVKSYMCNTTLLTRLFHMFNRVEPPILLKILRCINLLSTDPNCLENLQRAEAIKHLIPNLELKEGPLVSQIHHEVLNALFNLCKINKRRQEQAAENGIIPHLMNFIMTDSPLKQYALPLLCDMAHASRNSREQLRAHGGLDVYLSLLDDDLWSATALDSIAVCLAHDNDNRKVEQALLKKDAVQKLVKFFQNCPEQHFVHILEPFLKIITKSPRLNTVLAVNGLTPLLIAKLDHRDAIARLNLLKLIKVVYEHHPRPKQLIVENDLPQKLQNLIEERRDGQRSGGQVLVKQMATSLLKALHINTVFVLERTTII